MNGPAEAPPLSGRGRRIALGTLALLVLLAAAGWGVYWWTTLRFIESTDNAYVQAPLVQITPLVDGTVVEVLVDDTDRVAAGQPLVRLDPTDARLALERSQAALAQAVREVRVMRAQDGSLDAQSKLRRAEVERQRAEMARAADDAARRRALVDSGAVSDEQMKHAEATLAAARSALAASLSAQAAAEQQALGNLALSDGTRIEGHPNVLRAAAALREAWLALQRSELRAPQAGQVARRTVQVGQHVAAGAVLMSLIPLDKVWVEANFKEVQLRRMRIGQPVTLHADAYGSSVEYRGRVAGIGAGTGAAFALLPAQNATGNWIKVVQRVPVRIELSDGPLAEFPLRVGLSMAATVHLDGAAAAGAPPPPAAPPADARAAELAEADQLVRRIIDANLRPAARR
ncbi:MAG: HlyD family efflux transporter periplasmic adaptor subunit [Burkholderiaceae bacterium]|nr:HlyD family efflux transporter periplasmic adaptor subunit [Burkholderiaceae bacterium]